MGVPLQADVGEDEASGYRPLAEINITPLVDVMLVLLVIFMVTTPLMTGGVPVELPDTTATRISETRRPVVVTLAADGALYLRDTPLSATALVPSLRALRAEEGDAVVYVRADRRIAYGEVMELIGRVGEGGYGRVSLLSQAGAAQAAGGAGP
jgi:biopolymer transport protein TolR